MPNIPLSEICKIDTLKLLTKHENLLKKIKPTEKKDKESKQKVKQNQPDQYNMERQFKLANQAHIATSSNHNQSEIDNFTDLIVRQISIDKLAEEPKKLNPN